MADRSRGFPSRVVLVQEVEISTAVPPEFVRVTVSIPGRDGTVSIVKDLSAGSIGSRDYEDLIAGIMKRIDQALCLAVGVQGVFPGL